ncbi:MAG: hypothetical protein Fur0024_2620 [Patescibacteria group bacterium]
MENQKQIEGTGILAGILIGLAFTAFSFIFSGLYFEKKVDAIFEKRSKEMEKNISNNVLKNFSNSNLKTNEDENEGSDELEDLDGDGDVDIVDEALAKQQVTDKEKSQTAEAETLAIQKQNAKLFPDDHYRGNKDAKIIILEYSDPDCPYCSDYHKTMKKIAEDFKDEILWIHRSFPLDSLHPNARAKAQALECAGEQGKFWDFADKNYEKQSSTLSDFETWAKELKMNVEKYKTCVADEKYKDKVNSDYKEALDMGGRGTPFSLFIGDLSKDEIYEIPGAVPYDTMKNLIETYKSKQK